jgi:hypothetical protein
MPNVAISQTERLLLTGDYSDFEIRCYGATFRVRENILGPSSDYFKTLFANGLKESWLSRQRMTSFHSLN